ncbi:MAG TPA: hypothetical protein ENJ82_13995, partial [Bacteroidetes bacterium]|nr:hypothetical protein [Bacteroidota bacterium]
MPHVKEVGPKVGPQNLLAQNEEGEHDVQGQFLLAPPFQLLASNDAGPRPNAPVQKKEKPKPSPAVQAAVKRHRDNVKLIDEVLAEMADSYGFHLKNNTKTKLDHEFAENAAAWFLGKNPLSKLRVYSPTHDAADRAARCGHEGERAVFGSNVGAAIPQVYDWEGNPGRGIRFRSPGSFGKNHGQNISLFDPITKSRKKIKETILVLIHLKSNHPELLSEKQKGAIAAEKAWHLYEKRYLMLNSSGFLKGKDATGGATSPHFKHALQQAAYDHIAKNNPQIKFHFERDTKVNGRSFCALVANCTGTPFLNLNNSPVSERLVRAIMACDPKVQDVRNAALRKVALVLEGLTEEQMDELCVISNSRFEDLVFFHIHPKMIREVVRPLFMKMGYSNILPEDENFAEIHQGLAKDRPAERRATVRNALKVDSRYNRDKLSKDEGVRRSLFNDFGDRERLKYLIMLAFGPEMKWPNGLAGFLQGLAAKNESVSSLGFAKMKKQDRDLLLANAAFIEVLKQNFSRPQLFKILLVSQIGNWAQVSSATKALFQAYTGKIPTEAELRDLLEKVPMAELNSFDENLKSLLLTPLNALAVDQQRVSSDLLTGDFGEALEQHRKKIQEVKMVVNGMRAKGEGTKERNTVDWLFPNANYENPNFTFIVMTKTHDTAVRAQNHLNEPTTQKLAWFGEEVEFPNFSDYDSEITSQRNISLVSDRGGDAGAGIIRFLVSDDAAYSVTTLLHEVQHVVDHFRDELHFTKGEASWKSYQTEFRAYWLDGNKGSKSDQSGTGTAGFDNARQQAIFDQLFNSPLYLFLKKTWDANPEVMGKPFRQQIYDLKRPIGMNLLNSPRVDTFYLALSKCEQTHTVVTDTPLRELFLAVTNLQQSDKDFMNDAQAGPLQERMKDHLEKGVLAQVAAQLREAAAPEQGWMKENIGTTRNELRKAIKDEDADAALRIVMQADSKDFALLKVDPLARVAFSRLLLGRKEWVLKLVEYYGSLAAIPLNFKHFLDMRPPTPESSQALMLSFFRLSSDELKVLDTLPGYKGVRKTNSEPSKRAVFAARSGFYLNSLMLHKKTMARVAKLVERGKKHADEAVRNIFLRINGA